MSGGLAGSHPLAHLPRTHGTHSGQREATSAGSVARATGVAPSPVTDFHQAVRQLFADAHGILLKKHQDYGPLNIARSPGGPLNGLRVRLWDKQARLNHLVDSGSDGNYESLEDTLIDLANYALIGVLCLRRQWPKLED